ncbi:hypothetical protein [Cryptosporangium arvum]|uniref:hypothetical protein n=1 Tax=Cryptosporangium arvum TaxID=80871 RepID=UPI0004B35B0A|nr:hypothetical protein [Cryptosporangium arvum]
MDTRSAHLLKLSLDLRTAAVDAGRPDVATKVDELMTLIAGEQNLTPKSKSGVADTVQRILNGLGY